MIIMARNKNWRELTTREKAPLVLRGFVQIALLAAALVSIHRRPEEEINGSKWVWSAVALVNFMGIGPIVYFLFGRKRAEHPCSSASPRVSKKRSSPLK